LCLSFKNITNYMRYTLWALILAGISILLIFLPIELLPEQKLGDSFIINGSA